MDRLTFDYDKDALRQIEDSLKQMRDGAQKNAAVVSLHAAEKELDAAKNAAPVKTGALRGGLVLNMEKNRAKGKQVFQVWPTPALNHVFQKPVLNPGRRSDGSRRRTIAYYPESMEHGFEHPSAGRIPGRHYLEGTLEQNSGSLREQMVRDIECQIDKAWGK